jgi:hypothetical protein
VVEHRLATKDRVGGRAIDLLRLRVREVVREIRADDDQRFVSAPERLEHLAYPFRCGASDHERDDLEGTKHAL